MAIPENTDFYVEMWLCTKRQKDGADVSPQMELTLLEPNWLVNRKSIGVTPTQR